jgi:hypothetical protein
MKGRTMIVLNWQPVGVYRRPAGDVVEPWLLAWENMPQAARYLRLTTTGRWTPMSGLPECGPDGLVGQTFQADRLIVSDCAVGALLGRVGGSSASLKGGAAPANQGDQSKNGAPAEKVEENPSKPFAVGSHAVIKLPDDAIGPLFIGFNILLRPVSVRTLEITIQSSS